MIIFYLSKSRRKWKLLLNIKLKIIDFVKKHKNKIFIGIIVLIIIISINIYLGNLRESAPPTTSYEPHNPIISGDEVKSKKDQELIEDNIKQYMDLCNHKEYESAYNLISEDCRKEKFADNIENFKKYIDNIFDGNKIYSIQDYANKDNIYIYKVTITEDIMATGMNNENSNKKYEEKIVLTKDNEQMKLSVGGLVASKDVQYIAEDEYMKITINKIITYYDKVVYQVSVKNKTNYAILFSRKNEKDCIGISLDGELRAEKSSEYKNSEKCVFGRNTANIDLTFNKYFEEIVDKTNITFNKIRILEEYTGVEDKWEDEITNKLIKQYSATITIK